MKPSPLRNAPCPCGSGKKYKRCHGASVVPKRGKPTWLVIVVTVVSTAVVIGVVIKQRGNAPKPSSTFSPAFYGGRRSAPEVKSYLSMSGVDFSGLSEAQRAQVMKTANRELCTCGCRMTLAQCINTDLTCPLRSRTFERARQLVAQAKDDH